MGGSILIVGLKLFYITDFQILFQFVYCHSDVGQNTTEVLLEVYDHENKSNRFLGLGIVGVEELWANPSQRQIIPLQARPYEEDEVTGTLTVEVSKIYKKLCKLQVGNIY